MMVIKILGNLYTLGETVEAILELSYIQLWLWLDGYYVLSMRIGPKIWVLCRLLGAIENVYMREYLSPNQFARNLEHVFLPLDQIETNCQMTPSRQKWYTKQYKRF